MPTADSLAVEHLEVGIIGGNPAAKTRCLKPLKYSGTLDRFEHTDLTPVIGREYKGLQVTDLLKADDQVMKDLAATSKSR